ncbi:MAG: thiamine-phosphate kinase [Candidatus Latescibacteria bacterium]|nr:thiamine-phosphate kinase [Candidatus Latescibacterota bacterium]
MRLAELGELKTIEMIKKITSAPRLTNRASRFIKVGIGDDAAVLKEGNVVTTDAYIEDVHFSLDYFSLYQIGQRVACGTLSDIAAMAATPIALFISALLPSKLEQRQLKQLYAGMLSIADKFGCRISGGDIVAYPKLGLILTAIGKTRTPKLRSTAQPGEYLYVTGFCGLAETGRLALKQKFPKKDFIQSIKRHTCPCPRIFEAIKLKKYINALIDTSDGLSTDVFHIAEESRVKIKIFADKLPMHKETYNLYNWVIAKSKTTPQSVVQKMRTKLHTRAILQPLKDEIASHTLEMTNPLALNGGEDYELLFTSAYQKLPAKITGTKITRIGKIEKGSGVYLIKDNKEIRLYPKGYDHFQ